MGVRGFCFIYRHRLILIIAAQRGRTTGVRNTEIQLCPRITQTDNCLHKISRIDISGSHDSSNHFGFQISGRFIACLIHFGCLVRSCRVHLAHRVGSLIPGIPNLVGLLSQIPTLPTFEPLIEVQIRHQHRLFRRESLHLRRHRSIGNRPVKIGLSRSQSCEQHTTTLRRIIHLHPAAFHPGPLRPVRTVFERQSYWTHLREPRAGNRRKRRPHLIAHGILHRMLHIRHHLYPQRIHLHPVTGTEHVQVEFIFAQRQPIGDSAKVDNRLFLV